MTVDELNTIPGSQTYPSWSQSQKDMIWAYSRESVSKLVLLPSGKLDVHGLPGHGLTISKRGNVDRF